MSENNLPITRKPSVFVSTFGSPDGQYYYQGPAGGSFDLQSGDEFILDIAYLLASPGDGHWWEFGMNLRKVYSYFGFEHVTTGIFIGEDRIFEAGTRTWNKTIFIPDGTTTFGVYVSGVDIPADPPGAYTTISPSIYGIKVIV